MSSPSHVMAAATHLLPEQLEAEQRPVKPDPTVERRRNPRRP
jgi:hypothetical protein